MRIIRINDSAHLKQEMEQFAVDKTGIEKMLPKGDFILLKIPDISAPAGNIIKQLMLSKGGDCAVSRGVVNCSIDKAPIILMGTRKQYSELIKGLAGQDFGLKKLRQDLLDFFDNIKRDKIFRLGQRELNLSRKTHIMGILNVTPDSFSDGGKYIDIKSAVSTAIQMEKDGADIIDIGGESTRPGAEAVDLETELNRVIPVIKEIKLQTNIPISIDTYKSKVAEAALDNGANLVNDISGLTFDSQMVNTIKKYKASACLMHIKGNPRNMQKNPIYENIIDEILSFLRTSVELAESVGIDRQRLLIDPGIGFGKKWEDNFIILKYLEEFKSLLIPLLVGPSRKSFIGNLLDLPVGERLEGSLASVSVAVMNGADFVRVHDIKSTYRTIKVIDKIIGKA